MVDDSSSNGQLFGWSVTKGSAFASLMAVSQSLCVIYRPQRWMRTRTEIDIVPYSAQFAKM